MADNDVTLIDSEGTPLSFAPESKDLGATNASGAKVFRPHYGISDGAHVTFGSKNDAAWNGTDASASFMAVAKAGAVIPSAVQNALTATASFQTGVQAALGKVADTGAAPDDEGGYTIGALIKRGLKNWTAFFLRMPASLGQKLAAASFPVVLASDNIVSTKPSAPGQTTMANATSVAIASDQGPVPILAFTPIRGQSLAITAGTSATGTPVPIAAADWAGATAVRVRNPASSAGPVAYRLAAGANQPPVLPVAYDTAGKNGAVGDKSLDPGAVEVFQLSSAQQALLAAGTLTLSVISPSAGSMLVFTPGTGV